MLAAGLAATRLCHTGVVWVEEAYPTAAAIQLLDGKSLYRDIWFDKPPLLAYTYLLWDAQIGIPLRIAGAAFIFLCCLMVRKFARELWGPREGLTSAVATAFFLTFGIPSAVMALAPDLLVIFPHVAAVYLAWRGRAFWSGLVAGLAMLINAKAVFLLAACAFWIGSEWPMLLLGFALPNVAAFAWFGMPYFDEVWRWGAVYSQQGFGLWTGVLRTLNWAGFQCALVAGAAFAFWKERNWRMAAWLLVSFVAVTAGWRFFPRYYFQLLPVMAIVAARGYVLMGRRRAVLLLLLLIPLVRFGPRYVMLANDLLHDRPTEWSDLALNQDSQAAADRIDRSGSLLVWGYRPDIFAYTRRPAGTRFLDSQPLTGVLADRHLTSSDVTAPDWAARNRRELAQTQPAWIVDGLGPLNSSLAITNYPDLTDWLANYRETGRTRYTVTYRRK